MSQLRPETPPKHPIYGIGLSPGTIQHILTLTALGKKLIRSESLSSTDSFNNRIYFITLQSLSNEADEHQVLKLSGRFSCPERIQNEAASLLLIEHYCPTTPSPRVLAFSEDGIRIHVISRQYNGNAQPSRFAISTHPEPDTSPPAPRGWILMTRCEGRRLETEDLTTPGGDDVLRQIARYVADWRRNVPAVSKIGNLRLSDSARDDHSSTVVELPGTNIEVEGMLHAIVPSACPSHPITTRLQYYTALLNNKLKQLESSPNFSLTREIDPSLPQSVRTFIINTLATLSLFKHLPNIITFTHYDLSPRNILVSDYEGDKGAKRVTGLLDFEFAGFLPFEEEFLNTEIDNGDDWPRDTFQKFVGYLHEYGVQTPYHDVDPQAWEDVKSLFKLMSSVAPWTLEQGGMEIEEERREAERAVGMVRECIRTLSEGRM